MALDAARPEQKIPSNGAASNGELRQQPRRRRALIADEDPSVVCLLQRVLVDDFEVTVAANGQAAVDLVGTCQPDAIVLDLEMPVLDGFGACRTIRAAHPQIPIVIVSGRTDEDAVRLAFEAGATDYLAKPFTSSQLRARLQACLLRCS